MTRFPIRTLSDVGTNDFVSVLKVLQISWSNVLMSAFKKKIFVKGFNCILNSLNKVVDCCTRRKKFFEVQIIEKLRI